jgi:hypothetical protein
MRDEKRLTKIVAACLLGDGCVYTDKRDKGNSSFSMTMTQSSLPYLEHLAQHLEAITSVSIIKSSDERVIQISGVEAHCKPTYMLSTKRHPFYTKFYNRMYGSGKKCVDPHYLKLLDWEFLAHWYVQDGSLSGFLVEKKYPVLELDICSHSFSYADNMFLRSKLKDTLGLDFNVRSTKYPSGILYSLRTRKQETIKIISENIAEYVPDCFQYKIDIASKTDLLVSRATGPVKKRVKI